VRTMRLLTRVGGVVESVTMEGDAMIVQADDQEDPAHVGTPVPRDHTRGLFRSSLLKFVRDRDAEGRVVSDMA
jgi:hypothetical protein